MKIITLLTMLALACLTARATTNSPVYYNVATGEFSNPPKAQVIGSNGLATVVQVQAQGTAVTNAIAAASVTATSSLATQGVAVTNAITAQAASQTTALATQGTAITNAVNAQAASQTSALATQGASITNSINAQASSQSTALATQGTAVTNAITAQAASDASARATQGTAITNNTIVLIAAHGVSQTNDTTARLLAQGAAITNAINAFSGGGVPGDGVTVATNAAGKLIVTNGIVSVTDGATISTDATDKGPCPVFFVTLSGNRTLANPTGTYNGQKLTWRVTQGTGANTLTSGNAFYFSADITTNSAGQFPLSVTLGKSDWITAFVISNRVEVVGITRGY